ncbi:MAG: serine hydrolase domain-containing protein [Candidatus Thorarchaeota archaeon]|jgi:CubicO group peptidase (beta-lactamase class C family)
MNSTIIDEMNSTIYEEDYWFDSLIVVKNGYIVYEDYPSGDFDANNLHIIHSATKSVSSMLIGTAIQQGFIDSVDTKILDYFPEMNFENMSPEKENITLRHIMTMTPGLEWDEWSYPYEADELRNDLIASLASGDGVQYLLDKPMIASPGEEWVYNTGCSNLLTHLIQETSDMSGLTYANEYLFYPLGITRYLWVALNGAPLGGHELYMTPRDMAKLGYLYLMNGTWNGQEIVTCEWIEESTRTHVDLREAYSFWRRDGYAYQWWTMKNEGWYYANGQDGQMICVLDEYDMVVVCTGYSELGPMNARDGPGPVVIRNFLIPSIEMFNEEDTTAGGSDFLNDYGTILVATSIPIIATIVVVYTLLKKKT